MTNPPTPRVPALIAAGDAADLLGIGIKRFKAAVEAGQIGGCWLVEIGSASYVYRARLEAFMAGKPAPESSSDLFAED
jgi:hypothetical protein